MVNKLLKKIEFSGTITLLTGLHIGGSNTSMSIGGIDKSVIRNPLTNQPYIPGSSLKGKMRSLLEIAIGKFYDDGEKKSPRYIAAKEGPSAELFGNATGGKDQKPSRLIVRDCQMLNHALVLSKTEIPYSEGKTEVYIDRITSAANPRQIERVPAGATFSLNLVLNVWEGETQAELEKSLFKSLELLRDDYLGGHGSRGYGHIRIDIEKVLEKDTASYFGNADAKPVPITEQYRNQIDKLKA